MKPALVLLALVAIGCERQPCVALWQKDKWTRLAVEAAHDLSICKDDPGYMDEIAAPLPEPNALMGDGGTCAPSSSDDPCVVCAKTSCCTETAACLAAQCAAACPGLP